MGARHRPRLLFDGDIYSRLAAAGTGVPVLNSERSDNYTISLVQRFAHLLTRPFVDGVVANSESGSRFAQRLYGYPPERMHVVGNGVRVDELERAAQSTIDFKQHFFGSGEHKVACLVGAIKPAKDYHLALDSAARLVRLDPEWRVLFHRRPARVGDGLPAAPIPTPATTRARWSRITRGWDFPRDQVRRASARTRSRS
jgi:glycosyltransferase involved in cell wall biosynthesis